MGKIRGTNSSPGPYFEIKDVAYASRIFGVTSLGLVGETLIGPAFDPIKITKWDQYVEYFGGKSAEKFKDSLYPKYELPYIAESYLTKSDCLYVCRVLGLSGYDAGPAFVITGSGDDSEEKYVIALLRSRGKYKKYANLGDDCNPISAYDTLVFDCDSIELRHYSNINTVLKDCKLSPEETSGSTIEVSNINYGQFCIVAKKGTKETTIPVSFNAGSKDYIYNVLGTSPQDGNGMPLFIEELYDVNLGELIAQSKITKIDKEVKKYDNFNINYITEPAESEMTIASNKLTAKDIGKKFLCVDNPTDDEGQFAFTGWHHSSGSTKPSIFKECDKGTVYVVKRIFDTNTGTNAIAYLELLSDKDVMDIYGDKASGHTILKQNEIVRLNEDAHAIPTVKTIKTQKEYFRNGNEIVDIDSKAGYLSALSNYREGYRCAMTPWLVSELKGSGKNIDVKKLFRFYTITDGNSANNQVKISISNIKPDNGTFDITVRDFYDSDANVMVLESFKNLNMIPGDSNYIGYKIGTIDGSYALRSKYVMVEVIENSITETCVPCGFLGYPTRFYGDKTNAPNFTYNTTVDEEIKPKKQYFGLSDLTGIDVDMLSYKGKGAYHENDMTYGYTNPFHLDASMDKDFLDGLEIKVTIDGDEKTSGITWETVKAQYINGVTERPRISEEYEMENTIYADTKLRKFTVCFYGGFDGWDIYRGSRTNTDEFKANKYKGTISNGYGRTFSKIMNGESLALSGNCITSDYYAYLAGINQFENPDKYLINIFATPGIDYVNNTLLVSDVFDMIEEKRGDALYVPTTPDKPFGASDAEDEMYTASEASSNLEDSGIDTYYGATYYPWIQYHDKSNKKYIYLPPTKDVVRNMADVDNKRYPWYAPAGLERGKVICERVHIFTKLDDENDVYDGYINPIKTFGEDGIKVWGNKTMYSNDTPMNRVNVVRLVLYMRKLIKKASLQLIFDPNDTTLKKQFDDIMRPILAQIKTDRGITDYRLNVSQTKEQMDAHEISANIGIKPTPTLEYIEITFTVTPQGVEFDDVM